MEVLLHLQWESCLTNKMTGTRPIIIVKRPLPKNRKACKLICRPFVIVYVDKIMQ